MNWKVPVGIVIHHVNEIQIILNIVVSDDHSSGSSFQATKQDTELVILIKKYAIQSTTLLSFKCFT